MSTLYKPELVAAKTPDVQIPAEVEQFLLTLYRIRDVNGGCTALDVDRMATRVRKLISEGSGIRRARTTLWRYTILICARALANQRRIRRVKQAEWIPTPTMDDLYEDYQTPWRVYNLLRACMMQCTMIWDATGEVVERLFTAIYGVPGQKFRVTVKVKRGQGILRCDGFTVKVPLVRAYGHNAQSGFSSLIPPTKENLTPRPVEIVSSGEHYLQKATQLVDSAAGVGVHRDQILKRLAPLNEVMVPIRWDLESCMGSPMIRVGHAVRQIFVYSERRRARRGYGTRVYRRGKTERVFMGKRMVAV